jgi:hypothetical protein
VPVELANIPINSGAREDIDSKLLPQGVFKSIQNGRLRKEGELGVRYGYRALTQAGVPSGTMRAFDVVSHNERLLAFGTTNASAGGPEKIFTFSEETSKWVPEDTGTRPRAFSAISELTQVFRPPFVKTDEAQLYDIAYANGHVALVFEGHATEGNVYVHIFEPVSGAVLFSATVASRDRPRVVGVGSVFVFAWRDSTVGGTVKACTFTVGTSTALSAETVLHNTGTVGDGIDLAPVSGASEFLLLVVRSDTNVCTIRRCTTGLAVSATGTLTDTDVSLGSVVSVSGGRTTVAYVRTGGTYRAESFTTSTLASAVAPAALFGGSTGSRPPGIVRKNSTQLVISASIPDTIDSQLKVDLRTETTLALVGSTGTFREVSCQSKPFVSPDAQFVGVISPHGEGGLTSFTGIFDVENGRGYECAHNRGFAVDALATWLGSVATDGTSFWAVFPVTDLNCANMPVVMQFRAMSPERRSTASLGGNLYIAGGYVSVWDGVRNVEAGYFDAPIIQSATPSTAAGALTPLSLYTYAVAFDWYDTTGKRHLSPVSDDFPVTMAAGNNTVTLVVSTPKSVRVAAGGDRAAKVIVYRTKVAPDRTKRRSVFEFPNGTFAQSVSIVDLASDTEISTQEVIYTQGARGTLSGPLQHEAAFPTQYLSPGRERITGGGLPDPSQWQRSKRAFPDEPIEWSGHPGHFGTVTGRITDVFSQDDQEYVATKDQIFLVGGVGPDDSGAGEFDAPRELPGDAVGVVDGRARLLTSKGTWIQAFPDRMYLLPRGGGNAQWLSQPVRDTLAAFPRIVGSAICGVDDTAVWACNDAASTDRRLVCLDLRTGDWYVDVLTELPAGVIQAICAHQGRIQIVIGNIVYRQDATFPASAFISMQVITGSIVIGTGTEGYGKLKRFITTGKHKARHNIEGTVSFDDGVTFGTAGQCVAAPVTVNAGFSAGDTVSKTWAPKRRKGDRVVLKIVQTADSAVASEGETLSNIQLEIIRKRKARRSSAKGT